MSEEDRSGGVTSPSLLHRLQAREQDAWRRFVYLYEPLIQGWCRHASLPADLLADLCQDVFHNASRGIAGFRPSGQRGAFRAWLRTITRNCLSEHYRRTGQQARAAGGSEALQQLHELPDLADDDSEQCLAAETVGLVQRAMELIRPEFNDSTWRAFVMVSLEDQSPGEVAQKLTLSVFAVRQACYRVRRRLRLELHDLDD
jgi:RNA polymerase sigma-70 factor (ECF subfamily)